MSPSGRDFTDDELVAIMMGSGVDVDIAGQKEEMTFRSQRLDLTVAQAKIIVDALSDFSADDENIEEVARQTQTVLMDRYGMDTPPEF